MRPSSAILRKASAVLLDAAGGKPIDAREAQRLAVLIAPRRPPKKDIRRHPRPAPAVTTSEIYTAVRARAIAAGDKCECNCGRRLHFAGREMDHWLNGNGRKKQKESVQTCWMLAIACHRDRQAYRPDVATWNAKFRAHCERHGYPFTPHIEHVKLRSRHG